MQIDVIGKVFICHGPACRNKPPGHSRGNGLALLYLRRGRGNPRHGRKTWQLRESSLFGGHRRGTADGASRSVPFFTEAILKSFVQVTLVSLTLTAPALAQGLVDPSKVAPEYREAAEKRRAEQIRQRDCAKKAETEKVLPRDRTAFLMHCLDEREAGTGH